jgi:hypothetical protein
MIVNRLTVAAVLLCLVPLLESCSGFPGYVSDHWPHWAGGMPSDVPPRPGAPGYDEFIAHGGADRSAAQSPASGSAAPEFVATGSTAAGARPATRAAKANVQPAPGPPAGPSEDQPTQDSGIVRGGLY